MSIDKKIKSSGFLLFVCGATALVTGISLVLYWWPAVVTIFKGLVGMVLAVAGLVLLYMIKEEKEDDSSSGKA